MGKMRVAFIQSMGTMLNAGLPVVDTLSTLQKEVRHRTMRKVIQKILADVESGSPLWRAMKAQYLFTPYEIALVRVGEEAGNLARNMDYLAEQLEKDRALKQKVKMAMIYPAIVLVLMFIIIMGLGIFVLPNLIGVLLALNADLPLATRIVIKITEFFTSYGKETAIGSFSGLLALWFLAKFTGFRAVTQWVTFRIPGIGTLAKSATVARFGIILGGLLRAGVPLTEALSSLAEVTNVVAYKKFYEKLLDRVTQGDSFGKCFDEIGATKRLLPISVQQLVITGEQSGALSDTLIKISQIYEAKAEEAAEKLPTVLEPMLLLLIGGLVGGVALAIIMPIYGVVSSVGR